MTEAPFRSYDDLPESDVATVLQVPLLWGGQPADAVNGVTAAARHRAAARTVVPPAPEARARRGPRWTDHPLLQVLEVGVVSALLVLALFGVALLALARWMP